MEGGEEVEEGVIQAPLHSINLQSDLVSGKVTVGVMPTLPVNEFPMLLGNDIAEGSVVPAPRVLQRPNLDEKLDDVCNDEESTLSPSCVVNQAKAKQELKIYVAQLLLSKRWSVNEEVATINSSS